MGGAEVVPFGTRAGAEAFAAQNGGTVQTFTELTADEILGAPADAPATETGHANH